MTITLDTLRSQLELAGELQAGRDRMFEPQDLPGRYGRVVKALDHLLQAAGCQAVLGGGWAVWRHGYLGRVTQDVDVVLGAADVDAFLRAAAVSGFDVLPQPPGRWPKLMHRASNAAADHMRGLHRSRYLKAIERRRIHSPAVPALTGSMRS